jgi:RNA-directed DNA polymerase
LDGLSIEQTAQLLRQSWSDIRQALLARRYRPSSVRKVWIPKPDGSQRELGIPTAVDRLIQQTLLQVLQPLIASTSSERSHVFRPGRRSMVQVEGKLRPCVQGLNLENAVDRFEPAGNPDVSSSL